MSLPVVELACAFVNNPGDASLTYVDLAANPGEKRARSFHTERGRNMELDDVETGKAVVDLSNNDRALDPTYASSTYYPNIQPVKPFRIRATFSAVTYNLFRGDVEDWPNIWDPGTRDNHSEFNVLDAFDALSDVDIPTTFVRSAELSGARTTAILDAAGWPAGQRTIDTGQSVLAAEDLSGGSRKALEMLKEVARSESGLIFIDGAGNFVFQDRHRRIKSPYNTSQVTLSNVPTGGELPYSRAEIQDSKTLIRNDITVVLPGNNLFNASDSTSQTKFRRRSYSVDTILNDANEGGLKASWLLNLYKDAQVRIPWVEITPQNDDNLWQHALGRDIGDRITMKIYPPGGGTLIQQQCVIERVEHDFKIGNWVTKWFLSPGDSAVYWVLGTSALGTDTRLAY